jgi:hypothetical protein
VFVPSRPRSNEAELLDCPIHGLVLHHLYSQGPGVAKRYRCKRCVGEAVTRRLRKVKSLLVEEYGGRCAVCGYDQTTAALCFHHVDPSTKSFGITMGNGRSLTAYREEARKCVLVCVNCHSEIEAGLIPSPPAGPHPTPPLTLPR